MADSTVDCQHRRAFTERDHPEAMNSRFRLPTFGGVVRREEAGTLFREGSAGFRIKADRKEEKYFGGDGRVATAD